jgi:hypothetical protein
MAWYTIVQIYIKFEAREAFVPRVKIREDLEEVSNMKSVPNLISYHHNFFRNFSQFLAIYFELFSSGGNFNMKIADMRGPPATFHAGPACQCAIATWLPRARAARVP